MSESLFDIFGDHHTRQVTRNITRQPFSNIENRGKIVSSGPIKPNEPKKPGDPKKQGDPKKVGEAKKSFLSNTGKALQSTPARTVFTPRAVNVGSMIYTDESCDVNGVCREELEFHRPSYKYDNNQQDLFDYLPLPEPEILRQFSPPSTPPPAIKKYGMEMDCSYQDEFFTDDFSNESIPDEDLGLPVLY